MYNICRSALIIGTGSQNYKCQKYVIIWLHNAGIAITSIIKQTRRFYVLYNSIRDIHFLSFCEGHLRSARYKYSFLINDIKKQVCQGYAVGQFVLYR